MVERTTLPDWIRSLIDDIVCEIFFDTRYPRDDPNTISVSEVTRCLRQSWFARMEPRCQINTVDLVLGIEGHRIFLDRLRDYGFVVEYPVCKSVGDGIKLCGRVDAYHPDLDMVLELKITGSAPSEPYDYHVMQTAIYMHMLGARRGFIVYLCRERSRRVVVFSVRRDERLWREAVERARILRDSLVRNEPPPKIRGVWCRYCPYAFDCMKIDREARARRIRGGVKV